MKFDLIRLVLAARSDLFIRRDLTREEWLRLTFGQEIIFPHRSGVMFHYVPEPNTPSPFIAGRVGRQFDSPENTPPESKLVDIIRPVWRAAAIIIDPTTHDDGQKVAFELKVGSPLGIMKSLVDHINSWTEPGPYIIEANPIGDPETFFQFEREHRGEITSITFELFAPNMFGIRNDLDEEMRQLRDEENARKTKLQLQNEAGLRLDTERVKQTAAYTLEGGGEIKARTKNKATFSSRKKIKRITVAEPVPVVSVQESLSMKIVSAIAKLFK